MSEILEEKKYSTRVKEVLHLFYSMSISKQKKWRLKWYEQCKDHLMCLPDSKVKR